MMLGKMVAVARQRGAALVVSLIMLVLMTLIGVTAMRVTTVQEKMVANSRDLNIAFQAAEAALLRGRDYIFRAKEQYVIGAFSDNCETKLGLCKPRCSTISTKGYKSEILPDICVNNNTRPPQWDWVDWEPGSKSTLEYGNEAGDVKLQADIPDISPLPSGSVSRQPRFIIEDITNKIGGKKEEAVYRITAQGYGQAQDENGEPVARVMLQSVFRKKKS